MSEPLLNLEADGMDPELPVPSRNGQEPELPAATQHLLRLGDARELDWIDDASIHLVVTSPPYWTLKKYNDHPGQLGDVADYETFHDELDRVWRHCYRMLVPGGRLV